MSRVIHHSPDFGYIGDEFVVRDTCRGQEHHNNGRTHMISSKRMNFESVRWLMLETSISKSTTIGQDLLVAKSDSFNVRKASSKCWSR